MKRVLMGLMFIVLSSVLIACQSEEAVSFSDEQLEEAIRAEIDKPDGDIYEADLDDITELDLAEKGIKDLDGIQSLDALETLSLHQNDVTDFSPLNELEHIQEVNVTGNPFYQDDAQVAILDELEEAGVAIVKSVGEPDGPGGFLWKVENGDTTVYLQGTIHVGIEDLFPLHEKTEEAYVESDIVVPEIDTTAVNPLDAQELTMELGTYQDGSLLQDHVSDDLYMSVSDTLEKFGMPMKAMENFKPWMLATLIQQLMDQKLGFMSGVDEYFLNKAAEDDKDIIPLETMEEQLSIFADTSPEFQEKQLEESLVDIDDYEKDIRELISLYMEGDVDNLLDGLTEEEVTAPNAEDQAFMEALNDERNHGMAETIMEFLEEDSDLTYFVIVGSLHLILEPHVRSILEDEGYEIEQIL